MCCTRGILRHLSIGPQWKQMQTFWCYQNFQSQFFSHITDTWSFYQTKVEHQLKFLLMSYLCWYICFYWGNLSLFDFWIIIFHRCRIGYIPPYCGIAWLHLLWYPSVTSGYIGLLCSDQETNVIKELTQSGKEQHQKIQTISFNLREQ